MAIATTDNHMSVRTPLPWSADPGGGGSNPAIEPQQALVELRRMWESGLPFFTKAVMRDVQAQLQTAQRGDRIRVPSLIGTDIYYRVCTGEESKGWKGRERRYMQPQVSWKDFYSLQEGLVSWGGRLSHFPYSSMSICAEVRQISSAGTPISPFRVCSAANARTNLDRSISAFSNSESKKRLETALRTRLPRVQRIVAFANSSISIAHATTKPPEGDREVQSSHVQHALMLALRSLLLEIEDEQSRKSGRNGVNCGGARATRDIALLAQDPIYTDVDRMVLGEHGIEVVDDPKGFVEVNADAAVLSFAPNIPVRTIVADIALPAMMIWDTVKAPRSDEKDWCCPNTARTNMMVDQYYDIFPFSDIFGHHIGSDVDCPERRWFTRSSIYIRKPTADAQAKAMPY